MTVVPYTTDARPDTGLYNAKLGLWLFLAAEAMFFGALFSSYAFLRTAAVTWPSAREALSFPLGLLAVVCVIAAPVWLFRARGGALQKRADLVRRSAVISMALYGLFMVWTLLQWRSMINAGFPPAVHNFYALYTLMSGLLVLHAGAMALWTLWHTILASAWIQTDTNRLANRYECAGQFAVLIALAGGVTFVLFYIV